MVGLGIEKGDGRKTRRKYGNDGSLEKKEERKDKRVHRKTLERRKKKNGKRI